MFYDKHMTIIRFCDYPVILWQTRVSSRSTELRSRASSARVSYLPRFFFSESSSITRAHNRSRSRTRLRLCRRQIAICLCIFRRPEFSERRFRSAPRFTAVVPILRISKAIPCFISLAPSLFLSLSPFSLQAWRRSTALLSSCLPARRLFHCAFALEVISKNFWRWIVPRDGNRGPTLPAAFTQTTGETTFPVGPRHGSLFGSQSAREIILGTVATFYDESVRASSHRELRLFNSEIMLGIATNRNWTIFFQT